MSRKNSKKASEKSNIKIELERERLIALPLNEGISYKKLCDLLNVTYYSGGKMKDIQLSEFSRYFKYEIKANKKIIITKIYETPEEKKYHYPANVVYAECIENVLVKYLSEKKSDNGVTYISNQKLYLVLGMINIDYIEMNRLSEKHQLRDDIRENFGWATEDVVKDKSLNFYINDFYSRTRSKFYSIIDSSFISLKKQKLVEFSNAYCLVFEEDSHNGKKVQTSHFANDTEIKYILKAERKTLLSMGLKKENEVFLKRREKEYYSKVVENIQENLPGVIHVYKYYKLLYNYEDILAALKNDELVRSKKIELNEKVIDFINKQANKNYMSTIDKSPEDGEIIYGNNYLYTQHYLSNRLMKLKTQNKEG